MEFLRQEYWSELPFPFPGDIFWPRDQTCVSCIGRRILYHSATREAPQYLAYLGPTHNILGLPGSSDSKESSCSAGDLSSIPGWGISPGEGNGNPLQYSCLENPMDGGAWQVTVYGVPKSRTRLSDFTFTFFTISFLLLFIPNYKNFLILMFNKIL